MLKKIIPHIAMTHEQIRSRIIAYSLIITAMSTAFVWGFITVYKNCYNSMHAEPMVVFSISSENNSTEVILLNKKYRLSIG